jgi:hypothetical protein
LLDNARGVCLLRLGRAEEAVGVFRALVVGSGLQLRRDVPLALLVNFAAALLLAQNLEGCRGALRDIGAACEGYSGAINLQRCIQAWQRGLSCGDRLKMWLLGRAKPITLDFPPGEVVGG